MSNTLQQLGLQQAKTELDEAEALVYRNSKDFPGLSLTDAPHNHVLTKIGKAKKWIEALQKEGQ
jgi:hypothetical protein